MRNFLTCLSLASLILAGCAAPSQTIVRTPAEVRTTPDFCDVYSTRVRFFSSTVYEWRRENDPVNLGYDLADRATHERECGQEGGE